ncbi:uncharacterized protein LOC108141565 [Drosophila elegans]|uniref:uncharacterized protein LOC108141565 n=1 Tax=Drosophila elegans TaxID=30023 RepID=UPI0007E7362F|nr:uncharacterized protein LOC108141565 [Drosophila elegans]
MWENRRHLSVHAHHGNTLDQPLFPTLARHKSVKAQWVQTIVADLKILSSPEADCPC